MTTELFIAKVRRVDDPAQPERTSIAMTWDEVIKWQWTYFDRVSEDWRNAGIRMAPKDAYA